MGKEQNKQKPKPNHKTPTTKTKNNQRNQNLKINKKHPQKISNKPKQKSKTCFFKTS